MPGLPPKPRIGTEDIGPDATAALKHAKHAKTPKMKARWEAVAERAYAAYIKKLNEHGIASGTTRRKVFGRGRKRTRRYFGL